MAAAIKIELNVNDGDGSNLVTVKEEPNTDSDYGYVSNPDLSGGSPNLDAIKQPNNENEDHRQGFLPYVTKLSLELKATTNFNAKSVVDGLLSTSKLDTLEIDYYGNKEQFKNLLHLLVSSRENNFLTSLNISLCSEPWWSFDDLFDGVTINESFKSIHISEREKTKYCKEFIFIKKEYILIRNAEPSLVKIFCKFGHVGKVDVITFYHEYANQVKEECETIHTLSEKPLLLNVQHGSEASKTRGFDQLIPLSDQEEIGSTISAPTGQCGSTTSELLAKKIQHKIKTLEEQLKAEQVRMEKKKIEMERMKHENKKIKLAMMILQLRNQQEQLGRELKQLNPGHELMKPKTEQERILRRELKRIKQKLRRKAHQMKLAEEHENKLDEVAQKDSKRKENPNVDEDVKRIKSERC